MTVTNELIDSLLANYKKPEDLIGENGLLKQLTKKLVERALEAEMAHHLGHAKNETVANTGGNTRNGRSKKTLKGDFGELPIEVPRDRHASFEPQIVTKHQTRWSGFDDKILSLYARGMTVREIQSHLEEMYGAQVSPTLISSVTDAVMDDAKAWQARPLEALYPRVRHQQTQVIDSYRADVKSATTKGLTGYLVLVFSGSVRRSDWTAGY
jgi:putative transposase